MIRKHAPEVDSLDPLERDGVLAEAFAGVLRDAVAWHCKVLRNRSPADWQDDARERDPERDRAAVPEGTRAPAEKVGEQRLFKPFLDLVEALSWRVSAICQLWASDIDRSTSATAPHGRIRKRGRVDSSG